VELATLALQAINPQVQAATTTPATTSVFFGMQVAKWGNSLAVRLPAAVVEALELKEGDEIEIQVADARQFGVARKPRRDELLRRLRAFCGHLPPDFKFDRDEANARYFFDTSVLIYVASGDAAKADRAEAAIAAGGSISVQVLSELANVARRKCRCRGPTRMRFST